MKKIGKLKLDNPDCELCQLLLGQGELTVEEINAYHRGEEEWQTFPKRVQELLRWYWNAEEAREERWGFGMEH